MKVRAVKPNNRKRAFDVRIGKRGYLLPYSKTEPQPTTSDPVRRAFVDDEIGREGFTYVLESGREGTVHVEQVLQYNEDPSYLRDALLYRLTIEEQKRIEKSIDQLVSLLRILDCEVDLVVRARSA